MKARIRYWNGLWWCKRLWFTGQGNSIQEAWDDMWVVYGEFVRECNRFKPEFNYNPRA